MAAAGGAHLARLGELAEHVVAVAEQGQRGAAALVDGKLRNEDLDGIRVLLVLDEAVPLNNVRRAPTAGSA